MVTIGYLNVECVDGQRDGAADTNSTTHNNTSIYI